MARVREVRRLKELTKRGKAIATVGFAIIFAGLGTTPKMDLPWVVFGGSAAFGLATGILGLIVAKRANGQLAALDSE